MADFIGMQQELCILFLSEPKWLHGEVLERRVPVLYKVLVNGATGKRHVDKMRAGSGIVKYQDSDYSSTGLDTQAPSETAEQSRESNGAALPPRPNVIQ